MSHEYEKGSRYIEMKLYGKNERLHARNTAIFTHEKQPDGDHICIIHKVIDKEEGTVEATYLWRSVLEATRPGSFNALAEKLEEVGCDHNRRLFMDDTDAERYFSYFGKYALLLVQEHELTHRMEGHVARLALTLDTMPIKDIMAEMELPGSKPYPERWA